MNFTVAKPFRTPTQRFAAGARLEDLDPAAPLGPMTVAEWEARGFLVPDDRGQTTEDRPEGASG